MNSGWGVVLQNRADQQASCHGNLRQISQMLHARNNPELLCQGILWRIWPSISSKDNRAWSSYDYRLFVPFHSLLPGAVAQVLPHRWLMNVCGRSLGSWLRKNGDFMINGTMAEFQLGCAPFTPFISQTRMFAIILRAIWPYSFPMTSVGGRSYGRHRRGPMSGCA